MRARSLLLLVLCACRESAPPTAAVSPPTTSTTPTPTATTAAPVSPPRATAAGPRSIPAPDVTCASDADCVLFDEELTDAPPRTYACCSGCTSHAASRAGLAAFRKACEASPAPQCPPIGCVMPPRRAACVARRCEVVPDR